MLARYSAIGRKHARAALARQLPDGDEATWDEATNARWAKLREHARRVVAGNVASGCGPATHWGGSKMPRDHERMTRAVREGRWRVVVCSEPTANTFLEEIR